MGDRTKGNDARRVDLPVKIEVLVLDLIKIGRLLESRVVPAPSESDSSH
jgi:hypothetical protein